MQTRTFGQLGAVSALSLGGGGIGGTWGPRTRSESVATVHAAVEAGITLIDVAPTYGKGEAELVVGEAFSGRLPAGIRITTKVALFARWSQVRPMLLEQPLTADRLNAAIGRSLNDSLARLQTSHVDILFVHDPLIPDGQPPTALGLPLSLYQDVVRPTMARLAEEGRIGAWAISATGDAPTCIAALKEDPAPRVAQVEANVLRSRAATGSSDLRPGATELIATADRRGVAVMVISPTRSGALTNGFDRTVDDEAAAAFRRAEPFRHLAHELGLQPAFLAHRYALTLPGVATVTLGVKNRLELHEALAAEAAGPLSAAVMQRIDAAMLGGEETHASEHDPAR
ncbi:MAG: aldo/keto reductase [Chloroflexi bacterium]|nr:aldo/keto reductase [Chloroflexota bacterium]